MTWTAGDYALIITTATTAVTAITGVGLPLWRDYVAKRDERKEVTYRRISDAVYYCVKHVDDVLEHSRTEQIWLAMHEGGSRVDRNDQFKDVEIDFRRNLGVIELIAAEVEVSSKAFTSAVIEIRGTLHLFTYVDGKIVSDSKTDEVIRVHIETKKEMIVAGAELLRATKSKLGVK